MKNAHKVQEQTVPAGEFKAKCLGLIKNVGTTPVVITHRGKPVARLVAIEAEQKPFRSIFGLTPGVRVASEAQLRKSKEQWAEEWEESTERLGRQLKGDFREIR